MAVVEEESLLPPSRSGDAEDSMAKSCRHSRFSVQEDLIIARDVAASGVQIAAYGKTRSLFDKAATMCNENDSMTCCLSWKQFQGRCTSLQCSFDKEDGITHNRSGMGGGELNELFSQMREAREDLKANKSSDKEKVAKEEEEKERIGRDFVAASMGRCARLGADYCSDGDSDSGDTPRATKKQKRSAISSIRGELAAFGEQLKESDLARVNLEREQLSLETERFAAEGIDRERDREERVAEREASQKTRVREA